MTGGRSRTTLAAVAAGELPPTVGLMRLLADAETPDEAATQLVDAAAEFPPGGRDRLHAVSRLLAARPDAFATVKAVLREAVHDASRGETSTAAVSRWQAVFDRLAATDPDAGSALYSFGNADLLDAATRDVVRLLDRWGLIGPTSILLEIGCGSGRFLHALAPPATALAVGIDASAGMLSAAGRRIAGFAGTSLVRTTGLDLAAFADGSVDLVLAADSFPYLVLAGAGVAACHVREAGRVLRPGGTILILNLSYRGDPERDIGDFEAWSARAGLAVERAGTRDLSTWDGTTFLARKAPTRA